MKTLAAIFLILAAASVAYGQTVKTLGYNTTNGQVVYFGTNTLTFTNAVGFSTNAAATTRTNLGLGLPALTNTSNAAFRSAIGVAPVPIFKVLTNDFTITNQTNMTVVNGLTISTEAGKAYVFELFPIVSASGGSTSFQIVPTNSTVYGNWVAEGSVGYSTNLLTNVFTRAVSSARVLVQKFYVTSGTNAGSISFQFSSTTNANTNTIAAGSYMMAQEVTPTP